jgi:hypothetical protein
VNGPGRTPLGCRVIRGQSSPRQIGDELSRNLNWFVRNPAVQIGVSQAIPGCAHRILRRFAGFAATLLSPRAANGGLRSPGRQALRPSMVSGSACVLRAVRSSFRNAGRETKRARPWQARNRALSEKNYYRIPPQRLAT